MQVDKTTMTPSRNLTKAKRKMIVMKVKGLQVANESKGDIEQHLPVISWKNWSAPSQRRIIPMYLQEKRWL